MSTSFQDLIDDFERLVDRSADLSGNDLRANRRQQTKVEQLIASLAEHGMYGYKADYADCRDIGHRWSETFSQWEANSLSRLCVCDSCDSERYDVYSRTGGLVSRRYVYPEGYLLTDEDLKEIGGGLKRYWRAVNIQREITGV